MTISGSGCKTQDKETFKFQTDFAHFMSYMIPPNPTWSHTPCSDLDVGPSKIPDSQTRQRIIYQNPKQNPGTWKISHSWDLPAAPLSPSDSSPARGRASSRTRSRGRDRPCAILRREGRHAAALGFHTTRSSALRFLPRDSSSCLVF